MTFYSDLSVNSKELQKITYQGKVSYTFLDHNAKSFEPDDKVHLFGGPSCNWCECFESCDGSIGWTKGVCASPGLTKKSKAFGPNNGCPCMCYSYRMFRQRMGCLERMNRISSLPYVREIGNQTMAFDTYLEVVIARKRFSFDNKNEKIMNDVFATEALHSWKNNVYANKVLVHWYRFILKIRIRKLFNTHKLSNNTCCIVM